jgi:hypothetical protein
MLPINYNGLNFALVKDKANFLKETSKEVRVVGNLYYASKISLGVPADRVNLYAAEGSRIYKIEYLSPNPNKELIGYAIYIPSERRLDIYNAPDTRTPLLQVAGKKVMFKNYSQFLDRLGLDNLFKPLINLL